MQATIGIITFTLSSLMLCLSSLLTAEAAAERTSDRFWVAIAATSLQLGLISTATSLFHQLTPAWWLIAQFVILGIVLYYRRLAGTSPSGHKAADSWSTYLHGIRSRLSTLSRTQLILLLTVLGFISLSGLLQILTPTFDGDDKMYHASRVLYWLHGQSVFPFITHNIRQNVFPFGSELYFLWPVLFTKLELAGRLVFWFAYPLTAIGIYFLLQEFDFGRAASLIGSLTVLATPIVADQSTGLKSEQWLTLFVLGSGYWAVRACKQGLRPRKDIFFLAVFAILAVNSKVIALAFLPFIFVFPWIIRSELTSAQRAKALAQGLTVAFLCSGLAVTFLFNLITYGNVLGPKGMRAAHSSDLSVNQVYTHAVRFPMLLLEPPFMPSRQLRQQLGAWGNDLIHALGADKPLPLEEGQDWPGRFTYTVPATAHKFSLGGIVWLFSIPWVFFLLARNVVSTYPRIVLTPETSLVCIELPLLAGILFSVRWMANSGVPDRFLVAPYALGIVTCGILFAGIASRHRFFRFVVLGLVVLLASGEFYWLCKTAWGRMNSPVQYEQISAPFSEAMGCIPDGSHILFVGSQASPDYPLFAAGRGYTTCVTPWGEHKFDAARMRTIIDSNAITHILVENEHAVTFHWDPPISTTEMVAWLAHQPDIGKIPLFTEAMRLFTTPRADRLDEDAIDPRFEIVRIPSNAPVLLIGPSLQGVVAIDPHSLKTPWGVEKRRGDTNGFLWIGSGEAEGIQWLIWSRERRGITLSVDAIPGPSRPDSPLTIQLSSSLPGKSPTTAIREFSSPASLTFNLQLSPGRNMFRLFALDKATIAALPNGDTRHLLIGLKGIRIDDTRSMEKSP